jgi:PAS domain S-box-containing protein
MSERAGQTKAKTMGDTAPATVPADELAALRAIVVGTAHGTGAEFFQTLVQHLATAVRTEQALIAEFVSPSRVRTLAYWQKDHIEPNFEYDLPGTPCEDVVAGKVCHYPVGVAKAFPEDRPLAEMGIESYLGVPLQGPEGQSLGHLCVFDPRPMPEVPRNLLIFRIFAARAVAEMQRLQLDKTLAEKEQRYRDLYEEAPIAYVQEDLESRFLSANRAAMQILGIAPDQVTDTVGMSLIPDTPDAKRRVREAFVSIGKGFHTSGVVLELRRKDNGRPIWIQWWSKPDPGGKFTRTMFVDITDKVLMEQEKNRLAAQNIYLQEEIKSVHNFDEIVGQSPALLEAIAKVHRVAKTDAAVLITGETGTGKELFARAIHSASNRQTKPMIKLNCAALPTSLVESELFGHEKGAFSGAINRRIGRFELANGGTIFLDEIGEVPMDVQVKLLRVLQEREFERIGGTETIKVDVRIVVATNRDLTKAIRDGKFREDLYYRLNVFPLALPPLRERRGDISLLVQFLVAKFSGRVGRQINAIAPDTMNCLTSYQWPGNIRELENVLERAIILSSDPVLRIDAEVFGTPIRSSPPGEPATAAGPDEPPGDSLQTMERNHILAVLRKTNWVVEGARGAAKILDLHPNTLRSRMKKLGIRRASTEQSG